MLNTEFHAISNYKPKKKKEFTRDKRKEDVALEGDV